jgi:60S ribosomal subunit assembly/export protein LOC1
MAPSKTATKKNPKFVPKPPSKSKSKVTKRPPAKHVKPKPGSQIAALSASKRKRKMRTYTDKELNLPTLNMITPTTNASNPTAAVHKKGTGKKKNKIYIDDPESMKVIMAIVQAEKDGQVESKLMKARALEEVREARRVEMERRKEGKKDELEGVKKNLKRKGQRKGSNAEVESATDGEKKRAKNGKKVSFAS